jgi:hypothetical protein
MVARAGAGYGLVMDDDLERLERLHQQDPGDAAVAASLKAALLRAGRKDDLRQRYRLGFVCKKRWDEMTVRPGGTGLVRHCGDCKRDVHLATTYRDFDALAAQGHCVAVLPDALPKTIDHLIDAPERGLAKAPGDPCLVEGQAVPPPPRFPMPLAGAPMPIRPPPPPDVKKPGFLRRLFGGS